MQRLGWGVGTLLIVGALGCEAMPVAKAPENDPQALPGAHSS